MQPAADAHALGALQFDRVLDAVAGFASTPLGAHHVRGLTAVSVAAGDASARSLVIGEHERTASMRRIVASDDGWPSQPIPELGAALTRLDVAGASWTGAELRDGATLLASSRAELSAYRAARQRGLNVAALEPVSALLTSDASLEQSIDKVVDEAGVVRDGASGELRKIRKQLRGAEAELIKLLERVISKLESRHRVDDASVTMRNGRWVVPVRSEGRGSVGGIVHDTSSSGGTVFVEPPAAVEFGNRIRELEIAEMREVERILAEASEDLRPRAPELVATLDALITLDSLYARARFAERYRCALWDAGGKGVPGADEEAISGATFAAEGAGFSIVEGRHPLLVVKNPEGVVPFSLEMHPAEHTLLVSGPNTGGKTVLLKAVALLSLMAQAGIPAPVAGGSALPLFDHVFADIGDEQSIEASLSTFSGHIRNLIEIVEDATSASLVLADELGSGTDPNEGAALGAAILQALTQRGTTTIATTHLGALKELALEVPGVVNASLQFDEAALAPTYRLFKGIPGRSYGLSIARRLSMPVSILENAEARVPEQERHAAKLIEDLEKRQRAIDERERNADDRELSYTARADRVLAREQAARTREREIERDAREQSRKYVLEARKEIEAAIAAVRGAGARAGASDDLADAAGSARRLAESLLASEREAVKAIDAQEASDFAPVDSTDTAVSVGDFVQVATFGGVTAQVIEARADALVVMMGSVRTTVPASAVRRVSKKQADRALGVPAIIEQPDIDAKHEIDMRGMRISEIDGAVLHALDSAIRADLPALRLIHGKGTGALRDRVSQLLAEDARVKSFRLGAWNEGGAGVTVVELA